MVSLVKQRYSPSGWSFVLNNRLLSPGDTQSDYNILHTAYQYRACRLNNIGMSERLTLLVVDDEEDLLQLMQVSLQHEGYRVKISPNGDDLFDIIAKEPPSLVLLDIRMKGIDGATICRLLKHNKSTGKIPILIFSANENIETITRECGADGCIKKPFQAGKLKEQMELILHPHDSL